MIHKNNINTLLHNSATLLHSSNTLLTSSDSLVSSDTMSLMNSDNVVYYSLVNSDTILSLCHSDILSLLHSDIVSLYSDYIMSLKGFFPALSPAPRIALKAVSFRFKARSSHTLCYPTLKIIVPYIKYDNSFISSLCFLSSENGLTFIYSLKNSLKVLSIAYANNHNIYIEVCISGCCAHASTETQTMTNNNKTWKVEVVRYPRVFTIRAENMAEAKRKAISRVDYSPFEVYATLDDGDEEAEK